jgi:hypothetical protein
VQKEEAAVPGDKFPRTETSPALKGRAWLAGPRLARFDSDRLDGRLIDGVSHAASLTGFDIARLAMKTPTQIRDVLAS